MASSAAVAPASSVQSLISRSLYRSLLRSSKPFISSPNAAVLTCLLHRTGVDDDYASFWRHVGSEAAEASDDELRSSIPTTKTTTSSSKSIFQRLLSEVVSGHAHGIRQMNFPNAQVDPSRLGTILRREFRGKHDSLSHGIDDNIRRQTAFLALRELNKKLAWVDKLQAQQQKQQPHQQQQEQHPHQAAKDVYPLPLHDASCYLRPGCFLVANPHLRGYFQRSVIVILDHKEPFDSSDPAAGSRRSGVGSSGGGGGGYGTYGLVINRVAISAQTMKSLLLGEALKPLSSTELISKAFSSCVVREGGPVHMSLQMLHAATSEQQDELLLGGHPLMSIIPASYSEQNNEEEEEQGSTTASTTTSPLTPGVVVAPTSTSSWQSDKTIYYCGDLIKAATATLKGRLDRQDVVFFLGASSWGVGQLQSEVERGCWLPCRGPVDMALTGFCEHEHDHDEKEQSQLLSPSSSSAAAPLPSPFAKGARPKADLWLSMMSACGPETAALAHLLFEDEGDDELGAPCDEDE